MKKGTIFLFLFLMVFSSVEYALDELTDSEVYTLFVYQSFRTYTNNWENGRTQELQQDPSKSARFFGYALCNQIRFVKGDSARRRIYDLLERKIKASIEEIALYRNTEGLSENARLEKEKQAQREFLLAITGWYSDEMANLTGVHPRDAPNFFTFLEQAQQDQGEEQDPEDQGEEQDPAGSDAVAGVYECTMRFLSSPPPPGTLVLRGTMEEVEFEYRWGSGQDAWHWTGSLKWDGAESSNERSLVGPAKDQIIERPRLEKVTLTIIKGSDGKWRGSFLFLGGNSYDLKKRR